jgi:hypothetical protein
MGSRRLGFRGLGFRGFGFRFRGLGFQVSGLGFGGWVSGSGVGGWECKVSGLEFSDKALGVGVSWMQVINAWVCSMSGTMVSSRT